MNKQINKHDYLCKSHYCATCVFFIHNLILRASLYIPMRTPKLNYMNNQIDKYDYLLKINYCSTRVFFMNFPCLLMCILLYFSFIRLHVCAYAIHSMIHCGSAFEPGASGLPHYCTPPVCVPAVLGAPAVWRQNNQKKNVLDVCCVHHVKYWGTYRRPQVRSPVHLPPC